MTRAELIQAVARKLPKIDANDVDRVIYTTINTIKHELINGGEVNLLGFGKFHVRDRAARKGTNPRTGEEIEIPASKLPCFTAGRAFKEAVRK